VPFHLNWFDFSSWLLGAGLDVTLLCLIVFRKPVRQLGFFVAYFVFLACRELWWFYMSGHMPAISTIAYRRNYIAYWSSEFVLSALRLATCVQVWWWTVRRFPAIWKVSWRALILIAGILLVWTGFSVHPYRARVARFSYVGVERFEFMQAILLIAIFAFSAYYGVEFKPGYRAFLLGLCIFSTAQCVLTTLSALKLDSTLTLFSHSRELVFDGVLCFWVYACLKLAPVTKTAPEFLPLGAYENLAPELNFRLRQLNNQLAGILHS
jgi:hypothetical protein